MLIIDDNYGQGEQCLAHLMELNANINLQAKDGRTPLHMTAINGRFTRAQMLLDHGALVDVGDKEGLASFHYVYVEGFVVVDYEFQEALSCSLLLSLSLI